ncbi:hypothetical protein BKA93DRAFT_150977 [Sparassis latifolia]|uniref:Uncharacterized protein n=1 Tax=Sparassis crispa TaxID=139825 RepID=A0A401H2R8_9APHY|nr:hypothetical protein SCP_1400940 [Sparassis crispa]GBE88689.1 hypothetical protein SCP_1400940 [Sparassis crispa]
MGESCYSVTDIDTVSERTSVRNYTFSGLLFAAPLKAGTMGVGVAVRILAGQAHAGEGDFRPTCEYVKKLVVARVGKEELKNYRVLDIAGLGRLHVCIT